MALVHGLLVRQLTPGVRPFVPLFVDVRDVARALVSALNSPPTAKVGRKRVIVSSEWAQPKEILEHVAKERPQVAGRLSETLEKWPFAVRRVVDQQRAKEVLGLEVTPWQKTILDAVDAMLKLEQEWKRKGWTPAYVYP